MTAPPPENARPPVDEPPPFWARWARIYLFVFGLLLAQTVAYWALTRWAS